MSESEYSGMEEENSEVEEEETVNEEHGEEEEGEEEDVEEENVEEGESESDQEQSPEKTASPKLKKKAKTSPSPAATQAKKPKKAPSSSVVDVTEKSGSSHPKYEEMIVLAIKELKSRSGCSRAAILKVLKEKYSLGDNEARITTNFKLAIKRGLGKGVFKMAKEEGKGSNSYKLGDNANEILKKSKAKPKKEKKKVGPKPRKEVAAVPSRKTAKTLSKEKASAKRRSSIATPMMKKTKKVKVALKDEASSKTKKDGGSKSEKKKTVEKAPAKKSSTGKSKEKEKVQGPRQRTVPRAVAPLLSHPAPLPQLPRQPMGQGFKQLPPKPTLKIQRAPNEKNGIILSWTLSHNPSVHATITGYQLYAYQETAARPDTSLWKRVGNEDVKAMPLPMACTLTQFSRSVSEF